MWPKETGHGKRMRFQMPATFFVAFQKENLNLNLLYRYAPSEAFLLRVIFRQGRSILGDGGGGGSAGEG